MPYGTYSTKPLSPTVNTGPMLSPDGTDTSMLETLLQPLLKPNAETVAFNARIRWFFLGLLLALQCVTIAWFVMICRVVVRVIKGEGADDSRSDDEEDGEEDNENMSSGFADEKEILATTETEVIDPSTGAKIRFHHHQHQPANGEPQATAGATAADKVRYIEVESSSEDYSPAARSTTSTNSGTSAKRKSKGISSGLNLGEHKDILNRIGCLSEEQLARERERAGSMSPGRGASGK